MVQQRGAGDERVSAHTQHRSPVPSCGEALHQWPIGPVAEGDRCVCGSRAWTGDSLT